MDFQLHPLWQRPGPGPGDPVREPVHPLPRHEGKQTGSVHYTVKLDEFRRVLSFAWSYVSTDFHLAMGGDKAKDFYEEFLAQLRDGDSTKMLANL